MVLGLLPAQLLETFRVGQHLPPLLRQGGQRTDERRFSISNYYCAGFVRQQENQQLGIASDIARQFPRRLQELCGYSVYKGLYGHVDNKDPITLLGRTSETKMIWQQSYAEMFERQRQARAKG